MKIEQLFVNKICCTRRVLNIHLTFILERYYNIKKQFQPYCKLGIKDLPYTIFDNGISILLGSELIVLIRRYLYILNIQHPVQSGFYNQLSLLNSYSEYP